MRIIGFTFYAESALIIELFYATERPMERKFMNTYIHERAEWPVLEYDEYSLRDALTRLHRALGRMFGKLDILGFDVRNDLLLRAVSDEIVTSSEIEGETLNRSSVRSSIAKRLDLMTAGLSDTYTDHYTEGVVEMALDAT